MKQLNLGLILEPVKYPHKAIPLDVDSLRYTNKIFNIVTNWDGGNKFEIVVSDRRGQVIDFSFKYSFSNASAEFERLKTKYIFDYGNVFGTVGNENAGRYSFTRKNLQRFKVDRGYAGTKTLVGSTFLS